MTLHSGERTFDDKNPKWKDTGHQDKLETKKYQDECENVKIMLRQILAASGPFFSTLSSGMTSGFSAVLLPQLMENNSHDKITENQASWIASIAVLPMALGCLLSGIMMERLGRCRTQRIANMLFIIGWAVISLADNYETICAGRFLTGLCTGIFSPLCLVYIAEISDPSVRGVMLASIPLAVSTGILISHALGTLFYWKIAALTCALFPLAGFIIMLFAQESPSWLILKGYNSEGEQVFRKLRGFSEESTTELKSMLRNKIVLAQEGTAKESTAEKIFSSTFLKPFLITVCFFFVQQFSGVNAVIFYSISILSDINSSANEYLATIVIDVVRVMMSAVACALLKTFRRRTLAILSALLTGSSLLGLTLSRKFIPNEYSWVSFPFIISYVCFISIGIVPIPWILTGEIFPRNIREFGSGCSSSFAFIMFFVVVKTSPHLFTVLGAGNTFLIFSSVALFGSIFLYFFLPETKNMTLHKIEDEIKNQNLL